MSLQEEYAKYLKSYGIGDVIIREGEKDRDFYCLLQGKVEIWKGTLTQKEKALQIGQIDEKGCYFGEMSTLLDEDRSASIIASSDVKVLQFPSDMLPQILVKQPKLGIKICADLADRLKGTTSKQQDVTLQRNELREDANQQLFHAKETFQKLFVMLSSLQAQLQQPILKSILTHMSQDRLLQGGRKLRFDQALLEEMPADVATLVKKQYADLLLTS